MRKEFKEPEWLFEALTTRPDGVSVHVAISIPDENKHKDFMETQELAQMGAHDVMKIVARNDEQRRQWDQVIEEEKAEKL